MTGRRDAQEKPAQDPNTSSTARVRDATAPPPPKLIVDGHVPPADGSNPAFFYSHTDVTDPIALAGREAHRAVWRMWMDNLPGPDEQLENYAARMSAATGESHFTIKDSYIPGLGSLKEKLPRLVALQDMLAHVSMVSLRKIGERVSIIDSPEALAQIDAGITDFLTPTTPRQSMPTTRQITKKINELINLFDPEVFLDDDTGADENPVAPGAFGIDDRKPGVTEFYLTLPKDMGQLLMKKVDAYAFHYDCSRATAFHELLAKSGKVSVAMNLYTAKDIENAPVWMPGAGWLNEDGDTRWRSMITTYRDLDEGRLEETEAHDATAGLKAWTAGVHDSCAAPSSTTETEGTHIEHRVPHETGGPTALDNLSRLSQRWHNLKTEGHVRYLADPSTGITVWWTDEGHWTVSVPEGPLSPKGARFARSVGEYRAEKATRRRAAAEAARHRRNAGLGYDPLAPPPF